MPLNSELFNTKSTERFDNFHVAAHVMAVKIGESGEVFDSVAYLQYSGAMLIALVAERLGFKPSDAIALSVARNPEYVEGKSSEFTSDGIFDRRMIADKRLLLLGDVWRSGGLLRHSTRILEGLGAKTVKTAVAYMREDHLEDGAERPDFYGHLVGSRIAFQWATPPAGFGDVVPVRSS